MGRGRWEPAGAQTQNTNSLVLGSSALREERLLLVQTGSSSPCLDLRYSWHPQFPVCWWGRAAGIGVFPWGPGPVGSGTCQPHHSLGLAHVGWERQMPLGSSWPGCPACRRGAVSPWSSLGGWLGALLGIPEHKRAWQLERAHEKRPRVWAPGSVLGCFSSVGFIPFPGPLPANKEGQ